MKLSRDREGSKPVAICDRPALFDFTKMDFAKSPSTRSWHSPLRSFHRNRGGKEEIEKGIWYNT